MAEDEKNNFDGSPSHREKTAEKKRSDYAVRSKMPERDENEGADTGFSWSAVAHRDSAANAAAPCAFFREEDHLVHLTVY